MPPIKAKTVQKQSFSKHIELHKLTIIEFLITCYSIGIKALHYFHNKMIKIQTIILFNLSNVQVERLLVIKKEIFQKFQKMELGLKIIKDIKKWVHQIKKKQDISIKNYYMKKMIQNKLQYLKNNLKNKFKYFQMAWKKERI